MIGQRRPRKVRPRVWIGRDPVRCYDLQSDVLVHGMK